MAFSEFEIERIERVEEPVAKAIYVKSRTL
jgi:hypothetical protein